MTKIFIDRIFVSSIWIAEIEIERRKNSSNSKKQQKWRSRKDRIDEKDRKNQEIIDNINKQTVEIEYIKGELGDYKKARLKLEGFKITDLSFLS